MFTVKWVVAFMVVGLLGAMPSFAETPAQNMISKGDHNGLATYYAQQAKELRGQAEIWEITAESYDKQSEPQGQARVKPPHAAHCRTIAQSYKKAAEEADALAKEHRAMLPHGKVQ